MAGTQIPMIDQLQLSASILLTLFEESVNLPEASNLFLSMPRSIKIHPDKLPQARQSLERAGFLTQGELAAHLGIALSTLNNFLNGKNVYISTFDKICEALDLDRGILIFSDEEPDNPEESPMSPGLDQLIRQGGNGKNVNVGRGENFFIGSEQGKSGSASRETNPSQDEETENSGDRQRTGIKQDILQYGNGRNINIGEGTNIYID